MYYHAAVLLLFRPFLKARFTDSNITPSDVCRQSAIAISQLFGQHRRLYDTVGIYTFQLHCLLTACTIHIINVPAIASTKYLTEACNHFHDLARWNEWAVGSLDIIKGLVHKWKIILPGETELALFRNHHSMVEGTIEGGAQAQIFRSSKRFGFLNPSSDFNSKRQKFSDVAQDESSLESNPQQFGAGGLGGDGGDGQARRPQTNNLFAPFPNQPAPLLGPFHTSTSTEEARQSAMNDVSHGFDGMTFDGAGGWYDPFMGFED